MKEYKFPHQGRGKNMKMQQFKEEVEAGLGLVGRNKMAVT